MALWGSSGDDRLCGQPWSLTTRVDSGFGDLLSCAWLFHRNSVNDGWHHSDRVSHYPLRQYRSRLVRYLSRADDGVGVNHAASGYEPLCRAGYSGARRSIGLVHWYLAVRCCNRHFRRSDHCFPHTRYLASKSNVLMAFLLINPNISAATNARVRAIVDATGPFPCSMELGAL